MSDFIGCYGYLISPIVIAAIFIAGFYKEAKEQKEWAASRSAKEALRKVEERAGVNTKKLTVVRCSRKLDI